MPADDLVLAEVPVRPPRDGEAPAGADPAPPATPAPATVTALGARRAAEPLEALLGRFGARLRVLVATHCRADQGLDPDDVEQEVRIRLWRTLERDRNAVLPASYIQRVVVTTVIDLLRRQQARPLEALPEDEDGVPLDSPDLVAADAEANASDRQQVELLGRCLAKLPERRRMAVELHLQGYAPAEIAALTGLSADAGRKLAERGLKDLREHLRRYGVEEEGNGERDR